MSEAFQILSDPIRRRILELLMPCERSSGDITKIIQEEFGISQPAVSQHLKILRDAGFAHVKSQGTKRIYALDATPLKEVDAWVSPFRNFFENRLMALHTEIARGKKNSNQNRETNKSPQ